MNDRPNMDAYCPHDGFPLCFHGHCTKCGTCWDCRFFGGMAIPAQKGEEGK